VYSRDMGRAKSWKGGGEVAWRKSASKNSRSAARWKLPAAPSAASAAARGARAAAAAGWRWARPMKKAGRMLECLGVSD
jgi:hypothetical protein